MKEEIIEWNKLIAEFMGLNPKGFKYIQDDCKFHSSWNWLMPVVREINQWCENNYIEVGEVIQDGLLSADIEKVFDGVVEQIKYINSQTQEQESNR